MTLPKTTKTFRLESGYGKFKTFDTVNVDCVMQRGKFYASVNSLNASSIGVGDTPDEAFTAWAKKLGNPTEIWAAK